MATRHFSTGRGRRGKMASMKDGEGFGRRDERGGEAMAIGDLLRTVAAPVMRHMGFGRSELVARWPEIVGPALAQHTTPMTLRHPPGSRARGFSM
ncbi:DciA family protein [Novosphingobium panipatense]|uniref:DciA family protein n=1 Tax=Novosphingobium panipatense TaxID=428991 RepID=UPI00361DABF5